MLPIPEAAAIRFQYAHAPAGLRPDGDGEITSYGRPEVQEYDWSQCALPRGILPGTNYRLDVAMADGCHLQVQGGHCGADVITAAGQARFALWDPSGRLLALIASLIRPG